MKSPASSRDIKKPWVQFVLEQYLAGCHSSSDVPTVEVKDYTITNNEVGLGFNSELVSLDVQTYVKEGNKSTDVEYNLKVKFLSTDAFTKELNKKFKTNKREYVLYSELMRNLNDFHSSLNREAAGINIPDLIYGSCTDREFVLVMENVKSKGFDLVDKYKGLGLAQVKVAVDQIALLHAVSHVYIQKNSVLEKHPCLQFDERAYSFIIPLIEYSIDNFYVELLKLKGKSNIAQRLQDNKLYVMERGNMANMHKSEAPTCLIHGDYWSNNIMFRGADENSDNHTGIFDCKVLDWGNFTVGKPLYDLQYLVYTSTILETRRNHLDSILHQYYNTFTEVTAKLGSPLSNWGYNEFKIEWDRMSHIGLFASLCIVVGTLSKKNTQNQQRPSTTLDHQLLSPARWLVESMKTGMAKALLPIMFSPSALKLIRASFRKVLEPMRKELLSGENEVFTTRVADLLCEADERGLFTNPQAPLKNE